MLKKVAHIERLEQFLPSETTLLRGEAAHITEKARQNYPNFSGESQRTYNARIELTVAVKQALIRKDRQDNAAKILSGKSALNVLEAYQEYQQRLSFLPQQDGKTFMKSLEIITANPKIRIAGKEDNKHQQERLNMKVTLRNLISYSKSFSELEPYEVQRTQLAKQLFHVGILGMGLENVDLFMDTHARQDHRTHDGENLFVEDFAAQRTGIRTRPQFEPQHVFVPPAFVAAV